MTGVQTCALPICPLKEVAVLDAQPAPTGDVPAAPGATPTPTAPTPPPAPAGAVPPAVAPAAAGHAGDANKILWVVGEENLEVELELEMIDFAEAKIAAETKPKTSK